MSLFNKLIRINLFVLIFGAAPLALAESGADLVPLINKYMPDLTALGEDPVLVAAVQAQNAEKLSLDEIKKRDAVWMAVTGVDATMKAMMENAAAKKLGEFEKTGSFYFESFVVDNQGANVAMTNKTSDYWQGDEAKFTESFKDGNGQVFIAPPKFDESAQAYLVQVSVPVKAEGKTIGVIVVGINLDELEAAQ